MKLNLKRYGCKYFTLSSNIPVSREMDNIVLDWLAEVSYSIDENGAPNDAVFVSQFRTAGTVEQSIGRLQRLETNEERSYRFQLTNVVDEEQLPRSRFFRPVSFLIDAASGLFGPFTVLCQARYNYERSAGYTSKIPLPAPMVSPVQNAITRIDGYQLNHVEADDRRYQITLRHSEEEDFISHFIRSSFILELNRNAIREMRNKYSALSRSLVMQERE